MFSKDFWMHFLSCFLERLLGRKVSLHFILEKTFMFVLAHLFWGTLKWLRSQFDFVCCINQQCLLTILFGSTFTKWITGLYGCQTALRFSFFLDILLLYTKESFLSLFSGHSLCEMPFFFLMSFASLECYIWPWAHDCCGVVCFYDG